MSKTKAEKSTIPPGNMIMIEISNHIILILGDSILLGRLKIGDEVLGVYGVDEEILEFRSDEYFI